MSDMDDDERAEEAEYLAARKREAEPAPVLSKKEFLAWRAPREVLAGPEALDNPLWHWLVRTRLSAYAGNARFEGPSPFKAGPMWCFDRFGMSQTTLPDGRVVYVGGEHEDHYDPDFFIYNDVVVIDPDGTISIYGYSRAEFPATDFHSTTFVGNALLIIGCLGYPDDRIAGITPVYRLSLDSWRIERVVTDGESPSWLHRHNAELAEDGHSVVVSGGTCWRGANCSMAENIDSWSLNVSTGHWTRLTERDWQQWSMRRTDRRRNRLWDLRQALWYREHPRLGVQDSWTFEDAPNFDELLKLYRVDDDAPTPIEGEEYNEFKVVVEGITVRFTEDWFSVDVVVEGRLTEERLKTLQSHTLETLSKLDGAEWEVEPAPESPNNNVV